jgi:hypothetical protein
MGVIAAALLVAAFWTFAAIMQRDGVCYYYPRPDRQSDFLQNYSPKSVMDSFVSKDSISSEFSAGNGSGAGRRFVPNEREFNGYFAIDTEKRLALMTALRDGLSLQLTQHRAVIVSRSGDAGSGFHFTYRLGQNVGSAAVLPVAINQRVRRNMPLPVGTQDIVAAVKVSEKWFPRESDSIQASIAVR